MSEFRNLREVFTKFSLIKIETNFSSRITNEEIIELNDESNLNVDKLELVIGNNTKFIKHKNSYKRKVVDSIVNPEAPQSVSYFGYIVNQVGSFNGRSCGGALYDGLSPDVMQFYGSGINDIVFVDLNDFGNPIYEINLFMDVALTDSVKNYMLDKTIILEGPCNGYNYDSENDLFVKVRVF